MTLRADANWSGMFDALRRRRAAWVAQLLKSGVTSEEIAEAQGVATYTIYNWLKADPDVHDAYSRWRNEERIRVRQEKRATAAATRAAAREAGRAVRRGSHRRFSDEYLRELLLRAADDLGEPLSSFAFRDWLKEQPGAPTYRGLVIRLGPSWAEACAAVGITPWGGRSRSVTDDACAAAVARIAQIVGRAPTHHEYEEHKLPGEPSPASVRAYWGDGYWSGVVARYHRERARA